MFKPVPSTKETYRARGTGKKLKRTQKHRHNVHLTYTRIESCSLYCNPRAETIWRCDGWNFHPQASE